MKQKQILIGIAVITYLVVLASCISSVPTCVDNPRNMKCFTPTQLEKELSK